MASAGKRGAEPARAGHEVERGVGNDLQTGHLVVVGAGRVREGDLGAGGELRSAYAGLLRLVALLCRQIDHGVVQREVARVLHFEVVVHPVGLEVRADHRDLIMRNRRSDSSQNVIAT